MEEAERDDLLRVLSLRHDLLCAALVRAKEADVATRCLERAEGSLELARSALLPYLGEGGPGERARELAESWKAVWGDPADPEVRARIDATVAELRGRDAAGKAGRGRGVAGP